LEYSTRPNELNRIVISVVRYKSGKPVLNIQREWRKEVEEDWQPGKRPALNLKQCRKLLTILPEAVSILEQQEDGEKEKATTNEKREAKNKKVAKNNK
jgi:hypothetical protein